MFASSGDGHPLEKWEPQDPQEADYGRLRAKMRQEERQEERFRKSEVERVLRETLPPIDGM